MSTKIEEELRQAETEAENAQRKLARVREKNLILSIATFAAREMKQGRDVPYNIALLRHYLLEEETITSEDLVEAGAQPVTEESLLKEEKDEHDRIAETLAKKLEGEVQVEDPDGFLRRLKESNGRGNGLIGKERMRELEKHCLRHAKVCAQEQLTIILTVHDMYPEERKVRILELMLYLQSHGIPYEEFKIKKHDLFKIGYKGLTEGKK